MPVPVSGGSSSSSTSSSAVFYNAAEELATVSNTFAVNGSPTDPSTVSLTVTDPDGTTTTYTYAGGQITRDGTGVYHKDVSCSSTQRGTWQAVWAGTGTASDDDVVTWTTYSTAAQRLYCTPEDLKSRAGITNSDDDFEILAACTAVSRAVDNHCDRIFFRHTRTRTFEPEDLYCLTVPDLVSVTTLKTDNDGDGVYETTWTTGDYQLLPYDAADEAEPEPYASIEAVGSFTFPTICWSPGVRRNRIQIAGVWGWPAVPEAIRQAAAILAEDTWKLKDAPFGVAGEGEFTVRVGDNRRAMAFLAPYRRNPVYVA